MLDFLNIDPVAFTIPIGDGFPIHWYGIVVTLGIAIGAYWAGREVQKRGGNPDDFYTGLLIVIIAGFVFARGWYVLQEIIAGRGAQFNSLGAIVNIRAGGLNILGGFVGALLVAYWWIRRKKLDFWLYADVAGPALLVAQSIGRWGNFINQELYGPTTELPWGLLIDASNRIPPYNDLVTYPIDTRFHPTFLYESLWLMIGFIGLTLLNARFRGRWRSGTIFSLFLIWWGGGRAWVEFFRPDQPSFGDSPITYSMVISWGLVIFGGLLLLYLYDRLPGGKRIKKRSKRRVIKPKPRREIETKK